jgi:hypothetical protein
LRRRRPDSIIVKDAWIRLANLDKAKIDEERARWRADEEALKESARMEKTKMDEEKAEWNTDVERLKESARKEKTKMDEEKAKLKADDEIWKESSKHAKTKMDEAVADKLALKGRLDPVYEHRLQLVEGNEKIREQGEERGATLDKSLHRCRAPIRSWRRYQVNGYGFLQGLRRQRPRQRALP